MPWRLYDENGQAQCDLIAMDDEVIEAGKPVRVVRVEGRKIVVRQIENRSEQGEP